MKHLYLLRHAKSTWDYPSLADFDRPLNDRGLKAAPFMGELMAKRGLRPELVISSPAKRAEQTAELVRESSGFDIPLNYEERIYDAGLSALLDVISGIPEDVGSILLVGHNPGMEGIVHYLSGEIQPMPTAALASVKLNVDRWALAAEGSGVLEFVIRPKDEMNKATSKN